MEGVKKGCRYNGGNILHQKGNELHVVGMGGGFLMLLLDMTKGVLFRNIEWSKALASRTMA